VQADKKSAWSEDREGNDGKGPCFLSEDVDAELRLAYALPGVTKRAYYSEDLSIGKVFLCDELCEPS
jgi:hypothetical protein